MNHVARAILASWSLNSIVQARSAPPVTVLDSSLFPLFGPSISIVRPDKVTGVPIYLSGPQFPGGKAINRAAFTDPPIDPTTGLPVRQGNLGRNALRAFGAVQWDLAVHREFRLHEPWRLQFRAEFFNILNHPNFASPVNDLASPDFGKSITTLGRGLSENFPGDGSFASIFQLGGPRSIQFGLKLQF